MADKMAQSSFILVEPARGVFFNLFEAKAVQVRGKDSGTPKFSANFLFDPAGKNAPALKRAFVETARAQWPGRDLAELGKPWQIGDEVIAKEAAKAKRENREPKSRDFYAGQIVMISRSTFAPSLGVLKGKQLVEFAGDDDRRVTLKPNFYMGADVLGTFTLQAYGGVGENPDGVTAYLDGVVALGTGERIGGAGGAGRDLASTFSGYIGINTTEDPMAGLDEEIPF